jgi:hypothetical protein
VLINTFYNETYYPQNTPRSVVATPSFWNSVDKPSTDGAFFVMETKVCRKCFKELPIINFVKHPSTADRRQNYCNGCRNEDTKKYRAENNNSCTRKYEKTKKGYLVRTYRNMLSRVTGVLKTKAHLYKGLAILDKEAFYEWALNDEEFNRLFSIWVGSNYGKDLSPSIDRINPKIGYAQGNIRWLPHWENSVRPLYGRKRTK